MTNEAGSKPAADEATKDVKQNGSVSPRESQRKNGTAKGNAEPGKGKKLLEGEEALNTYLSAEAVDGTTKQVQCTIPYNKDGFLNTKYPAIKVAAEAGEKTAPLTKGKLTKQMRTLLQSEKAVISNRTNSMQSRQQLPDIVDAEKPALKLTELEVFKNAKNIFVVPYKPMRSFRNMAFKANKNVYIPNYKLEDGVLEKMLEEEAVPESREKRKKSESEASPKTPEKESGTPEKESRKAFVRMPVKFDEKLTVDLFVLGSVVVYKNGQRIGPSMNRTENEWAILRSLGVVSANTPVVTLVHDKQVRNEEPEDNVFNESDLPADFIITNEQVIKIDKPLPKPDGVCWGRIPEKRIAQSKQLAYARQVDEAAGKDVELLKPPPREERPADTEGHGADKVYVDRSNQANLKKRNDRRSSAKKSKPGKPRNNVPTSPTEEHGDHTDEGKAKSGKKKSNRNKKAGADKENARPSEGAGDAAVAAKSAPKTNQRGQRQGGFRGGYRNQFYGHPRGGMPYYTMPYGYPHQGMYPNRYYQEEPAVYIGNLPRECEIHHIQDILNSYNVKYNEIKFNRESNRCFVVCPNIDKARYCCRKLKGLKIDDQVTDVDFAKQTMRAYPQLKA